MCCTGFLDTAVNLREEALRRRDDASNTPEEAALCDFIAGLATKRTRQLAELV
jgi:hypothetical protein